MKRSCHNSWNSLRTCLGGLKKTMKSISHDNQSPGPYLNPGPPKHEAGVLTTRPGHSALLRMSHNHRNFVTLNTVAYLLLHIIFLILRFYLGPDSLLCSI
jgi:hypothetical protein